MCVCVCVYVCVCVCIEYDIYIYIYIYMLKDSHAQEQLNLKESTWRTLIQPCCLKRQFEGYKILSHSCRFLC